MLTIYEDLEQGSSEWKKARCGVLTASEMKLLVTPATLKLAANDKQRAHVMELTAQRISGWVEDTYINDDMLRGVEAEHFARAEYEEKYSPIKQIGFMTNDEWGFTIGYSPDGLVGEDGAWECKGPRAKRHVETILSGCVPEDHMVQLQTGLLVSGRDWIDFSSYHAGLPMVTYRVGRDERVQAVILNAAEAFEEQVQKNIDKWAAIMESDVRLIPTERSDMDVIIL